MARGPGKPKGTRFMAESPVLSRRRLMALMAAVAVLPAMAVLSQPVSAQKAAPKAEDPNAKDDGKTADGEKDG